eukprot:8236100-Alexandrium_andersonii.AAC.2
MYVTKRLLIDLGKPKRRSADITKYPQWLQDLLHIMHGGGPEGEDDGDASFFGDSPMFELPMVSPSPKLRKQQQQDQQEQQPQRQQQEQEQQPGKDRPPRRLLLRQSTASSSAASR